MKNKSSLQASKTNFRRLRQVKAEDVKVTAEHPELHVKQLAQAIVRKGLKPVPPKASVSLRIDVDCSIGSSREEVDIRLVSTPYFELLKRPRYKFRHTPRVEPILQKSRHLEQPVAGQAGHLSRLAAAQAFIAAQTAASNIRR